MAIYPTDAVEDNTKTLRLHNQIYGQYMVHPNPGLPGYWPIIAITRYILQYGISNDYYIVKVVL